MSDEEDCLHGSHNPPYGWIVKLDHQFRHHPKEFTPSAWHTVKLLPIAWRLFWKVRSAEQAGQQPMMNPFANKPLRQECGVPCGGIGGGTIGRGWKGDFNRWQIRAGHYTHKSVPADQFTICLRREGKPVLQQVLYPGSYGDDQLAGWNWDMDGKRCHYRALYPQAWTVYKFPEHDLTLVCHQISPVIPHDYQSTSLPVSVFHWTVKYTGNDQVEVSIMFSFQNGTGEADDFAGGHNNIAFGDVATSSISGVELHHNSEFPYKLAIGAKKSDDVEVTWATRFLTSGSGASIWNQLGQHGRLPNSNDTGLSRSGETIGAAVACTSLLNGRGEAHMEMALAWDQPCVTFRDGTSCTRRYTRFHGSSGKACTTLISEALQSWPRWEQAIEEWQAPVLDNPQLPAWYKSALFNELYILVDSGTLWVEPSEKEQQGSFAAMKEYGRFGYLEGHEYRMYNTLDVHFYASFALAQLWPKLQECLIEHFASTLDTEDDEAVITLMHGHSSIRKTKGTLPHDVGDPAEVPWKKVNSYNIHDTSDWKDLNTKFILNVFRDYKVNENRGYLEQLYPTCLKCFAKAQSQDTDNDGIIDNSGFPDQTYDAWTVTGASAYCGGLYLAAAQTMAHMAEILERPEDTKLYRSIFEKGKASYDRKLWNSEGGYFNYDSSNSAHHEAIMADQLAGHWYLRACGLPSYVGDSKVQIALASVYEYNVMGFANGKMGAVNGATRNGADDSSMMSSEVWTGVSYALAANFLQEGLQEECWQTSRGVYETVWNNLGMSFQTPEAYTITGAYRSLAYMRPLSIWSIQWAVARSGSASKQESLNASVESQKKQSNRRLSSVV